MTRAILVTGATGKQGGSVVNNLLGSKHSADYTILAVTRDVTSASAQKLLAKSTNIRVVAGNLDNVSALFDEAVKINNGNPVWGVYSVQVSMGKGVTTQSEIQQGNDLIDESVKRGVKVFVYSSVERGGDQASWDTETPVDHFQSKYHIEHHLRDSAGSMGWTILRPVAFFDNLAPGMQSRVFLTALRNTLGDKPLQWVATSDIGWFATKAFESPEEYNHVALGLAGDELSYDQQQAVFSKTVADPSAATFGVLATFLMWAVADLGKMVTWFATDGYKVDIQALRRRHPGLKDFATWLGEESAYTKR